ncbi:hypothetical protein [[Phormidium] sp. ETS-05]|uniref:hypothetical protein n=1 Tax=[Phormidium] sp. ETS-05 TaxID=222819 RepID=UPI0018EF2AAA|nr:hypothetical protein [[Phormidium] sp. ETS-05]
MHQETSIYSKFAGDADRVIGAWSDQVGDRHPSPNLLGCNLRSPWWSVPEAIL